MRLDQFLTRSAGLSRKQAKIAIRGGRVTMAGQRWKKTATHVDANARITLDGEPQALPGHRYLMIHKPEGVVSATTDSEHPTVLDLLPAADCADLRIVGRLDRNTTGLLLLSTDGQWSHRVMSPRFHCPKTYHVTVADPLDNAALQTLRDGVLLHGEKAPSVPASVEPVAESQLRLTITEGRYHQVKRMLAAVGHRVVALHRERIGDLALDPGMAPGDHRALSDEEVHRLAEPGNG
ncbi:ribosomal small subunit pseudouridine synthase A [Tamilnaduibacter salinus]|uniref:Pseudouridine synthase n=1 Tax=Tamilnaduibacter salinus TaxID=1484056 RepID=A0A2A2I2M7_9GAMM|nr:16S rRNA pseudouridine(516) synthase [Tamilnaduibacter salinus]PAV25544.1 16S rRNA pseudouridine(516) synthase [Tamilnaduibacter salinus]PVY76338.1 ribosomal small subunit pseudouridine synthase A [Tamilnaduibacter salinus]